MRIYFSSIYGQLSVSPSRSGKPLSDRGSGRVQVLTQAHSAFVHSEHKLEGQQLPGVGGWLVVVGGGSFQREGRRASTAPLSAGFT